MADCTPPTAFNATWYESAEAGESGESTYPAPSWHSVLTRSMYSWVWTVRTHSVEAGTGFRATRSSSKPFCFNLVTMAVRRSGLSGCPAPVWCFK